MIKSLAAEIEEFLPSGCKLIRSRQSRLGGRNYRFEARTSDRSEAGGLAQELAVRVDLLPDPPFGVRRVKVGGMQWYATRQSYRFTIRVWTEVKQLTLPGFDQK